MSVWAVYARVSTEEQAKFGASLATQVEGARLRAEELGATETVAFVDEGVPGDVLSRPGLTRLREAIAGGRVSGLVVYDPDRLARNLSHQLLLTEEIQQAGVRLEFVGFEWKDTDEGRLFYAIRGAIAEYEKAKIRERTSRGKWAKVRQGYSPNGRVPYGYTFDKLSHTISVDEGTAPFVRLIFQWIREDGLGPRRLADRLNGLDAPPPSRARVWGASSIRHIVANPAYTGAQVVHRYDTEGTHRNRHLPREQRKPVVERPEAEWLTVPVPPLVDQETWDRAQQAMSGLRRKFGGRRARHRFLLSRVAACGQCGASLYGMALARTGRSRYYRCTSQVGDRLRRCTLPTMPADEVEAAVWELVVGWAVGLRAAAPLPVTDAGDVAADFRELQKRLTHIRKEAEQVRRLVAEGLVREEHVAGALRELSARGSALEELLTATADPAPEPDQLTVADLEALSPGQRQEVVRRYIDRVAIFPDGRVVILPRRT